MQRDSTATWTITPTPGQKHPFCEAFPRFVIQRASVFPGAGVRQRPRICPIGAQVIMPTLKDALYIVHARMQLPFEPFHRVSHVVLTRWRSHVEIDRQNPTWPTLDPPCGLVLTRIRGISCIALVCFHRGTQRDAFLLVRSAFEDQELAALDNFCAERFASCGKAPISFVLSGVLTVGCAG